MAKKKAASKKSSSKKADVVASAKVEAKTETALATKKGPQIARSAEEIDKDWHSRVEELKKRKLSLAHDTLQFYHDVGGLATELTNEAAQDPEYRKYGSHTSEELMVQLALGKSTFYAAMQFAAFADKPALTRMKDMQMSWSAVQAWLTVEEAKNREKLLKQVESQKIKTRDQFRDAVAKLTTPKTPDKKKPEGTTLALSQLRSFNTTAEQAASKALPGLIDGLKVYKKGAEDLSESNEKKFAEEIKAAKKHLATLTRLISSAEKALEAAGA
jgi:hypothetical protein